MAVTWVSQSSVAGTTSFSWLAVPANTNGIECLAGSFSDKTYHVYGTFTGGASWSIQGSNNGTSWVTLRDAFDNNLSGTTEDLDVILSNPKFIRVVVTGGDASTSINFIIYGRSPNGL